MMAASRGEHEFNGAEGGLRLRFRGPLLFHKANLLIGIDFWACLCEV